jgi:hypothetical protein
MKNKTACEFTALISAYLLANALDAALRKKPHGKLSP